MSLFFKHKRVSSSGKQKEKIVLLVPLSMGINLTLCLANEK